MAFNNFRNNGFKNMNDRKYTNSRNRGLEIVNGKKYINPYNFISLNKEKGCTKTNRNDYRGSFTGYIDCTLETKTETIIPFSEFDGEEDNKDKYKKYDFWSYDGKNPAIPGSELRGMIRNDFETFTNSCLSSINKDRIFISRTKATKDPAILMKDENSRWHLFKAERYGIYTYRDENRRIYPKDNCDVYKVNEDESVLESNGKKYRTSDIVYFTSVGKTVKKLIDKDKKDNVSGDKKIGVLFVGEGGHQKNKDSIFVIPNENSEIKFYDDKDENSEYIKNAVNALKNIWDLYNNKGLNKVLDKKKNKVAWYNDYKINNVASMNLSIDVSEPLPNGSIRQLPVWYKIIEDGNNKKLYLSLASIGKEEYYRTIDDLIDLKGDENSSYKPCIDKNNLCDACNIFGFTGNNIAKGSKIRVTDGIYVKTDEQSPYAESRVLGELASPRVSNPIFYSLYKTNTDFLQNANMINYDWNYDFLYEAKQTPMIPKSEIKIRGRKAYWHHKPIINKNEQLTKRNCVATPVKPGVKFNFKVFFDDIEQMDLDKLIATLELKYLCDDKEANYYDLCHKIGKGKPLGYGSVKIKVNEVKTRNIDIENNSITYNMVPYNYDCISISNLENIMGKETFEDILKIYNFNYIKSNYPTSEVTYPKAIKVKKSGEEEATHHWFGYNRTAKIDDPYVNMVLPTIKEGGDNKGITSMPPKETGRCMGNIKLNDNLMLKIDGLNMPEYKK